MAKARLKTPISYYGGKQTMLKYILPLIPEHKVYTRSLLRRLCRTLRQAACQV